MIYSITPALLAVGLAAAAVATAPAMAQDAATLGCWERTGAPGLFDWKASPSIACRDKAQSADAPKPAPAPAQADAGGAVAPGSTGSTGNGDAMALSFSGELYMGLGVAF